MQPVLLPERMRDADRTAIEQLRIPAIVLMENAARSAAEIICRRYNLSRQCRVAILCGSGNNGGDGFALARHLSEVALVTIVFCGDYERMSPETAVNATATRLLNIPIVEWNGDESVLSSQFDVVVDALLGVGAHGAPRQPISSLVDWANRHNACRIALDIPTGLDAATGTAFEPCFRADLTITMGALKNGLLLGDGPTVCGVVEVAQIGIPSSVLDEYASLWLIGENDFRTVYRPRKPRTTKFDYGRVLIIAGSSSMPGAAALCANAAVAAGAGLVELVTPSVHPALFPEVMPHRYERPVLDVHAWDMIESRLSRATVAAIGPGLGDRAETLELVQKILDYCRGQIPLVLDADALRTVKANMSLGGVTLTPHRGELSRILEVRTREIASSAHYHAHELSRATGATVVLKDFPVQISDNTRTYWATWYNPALATGGTGDVLTGIIAALWAQGYTQIDAAWMGVVLHALAGRYAAEQNGHLATRASHLIDSLSAISQMLDEAR
ncbi:MAG: NAD(P)H-hydrate dehydratase [Chlorobi bacterium]|nr:NAD(P)H-hydrate dehydratase [Chlorobiota bacterium]